METYDQIKKFLDEGGKCLLIENSKPIGVALTMEEYNKLHYLPEEEKNSKALKETKPATENFSTELTDMNFNDDDVTLEDLGLDELPY